jgi:hypothetical protein
MLGSSRVAAQLAASREGLGSMSDDLGKRNKLQIYKSWDLKFPVCLGDLLFFLFSGTDVHETPR